MYFSPRWKEILGYRDDEIGVCPEEWLGRIHPDDIEQVRMTLFSHINNLNRHFEHEHRIRRKSGDYIWALSRGYALKGDDGIAYRIAGSMTNIHRKKCSEERLLYDAFHDPLTKLPNRALFMDCLRKALENSKRYDDYHFSVLFLDLDRFKQINDNLGHSVGDQLLIAVSGLLSKCIRSGDSVARLGGDEFVILLERIGDISEALEIAERIQLELINPITVAFHDLEISASVGIVLNDEYYQTPDDLLRDADIAMYRAKVLGKGRHAIFSPSMRKRDLIKLELENDLRRALANLDTIGAELDVVFQPIISLSSGSIEGFEALVR